MASSFRVFGKKPESELMNFAVEHLSYQHLADAVSSLKQNEEPPWNNDVKSQLDAMLIDIEAARAKKNGRDCHDKVTERLKEIKTGLDESQRKMFAPLESQLDKFDEIHCLKSLPEKTKTSTTKRSGF